MCRMGKGRLCPLERSIKMNDDAVAEYYEREVERLAEEAARYDALFWQEAQEEVCAKQCN